jgi:endonuclease YncB( thermonuclease family)
VPIYEVRPEGDTIRIDQSRIRLHGIDASELADLTARPSDREHVMAPMAS